MPKSIEERVADLESFIAIFDKFNTSNKAREQLENAKSMALGSMILELATQAGLSREAASRHYDTRTQFYHDVLLRIAEDVSPRRSAELDKRSLHSIPTEDGFPPLFP